LSRQGARNPFSVVISIWRSVILTFWRTPLLILGCVVIYTLLSAYWQHYLPIEVPRGFLSQAGYQLLHALVFAPLVMAVIQMVAGRRDPDADIWTVALVSVGAVIALRDVIVLALTSSWGALRKLAADHFIRGVPYDADRFRLFYEVNALFDMALSLAIFLISVRVILLLPLSGLEQLDWKSTLVKAWRDMRGSYGFALAASFAAVLPKVVADHFLLRLYRSLYEQNILPIPLTLRQWEALLVRSGQLTLDYIVVAAVAATLYRSILMQPKPTAP
jgi:hypothetical protein